MSYESNSNLIHGWYDPSLQLPLESPPVTFSVALKNGRVSGSWKAETKKKGDVYVYSRDGQGCAHISLHASGCQHIKIRDKEGHERKEKWKEPQRVSPVQASFKLLFPLWSLGVGATRDMTVEEIQRSRRKNKIFIEGVDNEDYVISVCFFLTPPKIRHQLLPSPPMEALAILPAGEEKELHIIVREEHRPNFRAETENIFNRDKSLMHGPIGKKSSLFQFNEDADGRPYVTQVLVEKTLQGIKLLQGNRMPVELN